MDTNSVQMLEKVGTKIDSYLQTIGDKLGQGTDHFYPILVRQQFLEGWFALAAVVVGTLYFIYFLSHLGKLIHKCNNTDNAGNTEEEVKAFVYIIIGVILAIVFCFVVGANVLNVLRLFNPEYYVLTDILSKIR